MFFGLETQRRALQRRAPQDDSQHWSAARVLTACRVTGSAICAAASGSRTRTDRRPIGRPGHHHNLPWLGSARLGPLQVAVLALRSYDRHS